MPAGQEQFLFSTNIEEIVGRIEAAFSKLQSVTAKSGQAPNLTASDQFANRLREAGSTLSAGVSSKLDAQSTRIKNADKSQPLVNKPGDTISADLKKVQTEFFKTTRTALEDLAKESPAEAAAAHRALDGLWRSVSNQLETFARDVAIPTLNNLATQQGVTVARPQGSKLVVDDIIHGTPGNLGKGRGGLQGQLTDLTTAKAFGPELNRAINERYKGASEEITKEIHGAITTARREAAGAIEELTRRAVSDVRRETTAKGTKGTDTRTGTAATAASDIPERFRANFEREATAGGYGGSGGAGVPPRTGGGYFDEFNRGLSDSTRSIREEREARLAGQNELRKRGAPEVLLDRNQRNVGSAYYDSRTEKIGPDGNRQLGSGKFYDRTTNKEITDPSKVADFTERLLAQERAYQNARARLEDQAQRERISALEAFNRQILAEQLRLGAALPKGADPTGTARQISPTAAYVNTGKRDGYYADIRTGAALQDGSPELARAKEAEARALERSSRVEQELQTASQLLINERLGLARRVGNSQNFIDTSLPGRERIAVPSGNGYRYLDDTRDALRQDTIRAQDQRATPRTFGQGFLGGLTSAGFGGGNGGISLGGIGQAVGNTVKYSVLYDSLNQVQNALQGVVQEILNYDDSIANLNLALGDAGDASDPFINSLADIASYAGANVGDAMDVASQGMRAFGNSANEADGDITELGRNFAKTVADMSLITGQDLPTTSSQIRAIASGFNTSGRAPSSIDLTGIQDSIVGAKRFGGDADDIQEALQAIATSGTEAGFSRDELANIGSRVTAQLGESGTLAGSRLSRIFSIVGGNQGQNAIRSLNDSLPQGQRIDQNGDTASQLRQLSGMWDELSEAQRNALGNSLGGTANTRELFTLLSNGDEILNTTGEGFDYLGKGAEEVERRMNSLTGSLKQIQGNLKNIITAVNRSGALEPLAVALKGIVVVTGLVRQSFQAFNLIPKPIREIAFALLAVYAAMKLIRSVNAAGGIRNFVGNAANRAEGAVNPASAYYRNQNRQQRQNQPTPTRPAFDPSNNPNPIGPAPARSRLNPDGSTTPVARSERLRAAADIQRQRVADANAERRAASAAVRQARASGGLVQQGMAERRLEQARAAQASALRRQNALERGYFATRRQEMAANRGPGFLGGRLRADARLTQGGSLGNVRPTDVARGLRDGVVAGARGIGAGLSRAGGYLSGGASYREIRRERIAADRAAEAAGTKQPQRRLNLNAGGLDQIRQAAAQGQASVLNRTQAVSERLRGRGPDAGLAANAAAYGNIQKQAAANVREAARQLNQIRAQRVNVNDPNAVRARGQDLARAQNLLNRAQAEQRRADAGAVRAQQAADASARRGIGGALGQRVANLNDRIGNRLSGALGSGPDKLAGGLNGLARPLNAAVNGLNTARRAIGNFTGDLRQLSKVGPTIRDGFRDLTSGNFAQSVAGAARRGVASIKNVLSSELGALGAVMIGISLISSAYRASKDFVRAGNAAEAGITATGNVSSLSADEARKAAEERTAEGAATVEAGQGFFGSMTDFLSGDGKWWPERQSKRIQEDSDRAAAALTAYADAIAETQKAASVSGNATVDLSTQENLQNSLQAMQDGGRSASSQLRAFNTSLNELATNVQDNTHNLNEVQREQVVAGAGVNATQSLTDLANDARARNEGDIYRTLRSSGAQDEVGALTQGIVEETLASGADITSKEGKQQLLDALKKQYRDFFIENGLDKDDATRLANDLATQTQMQATAAATKLTSIDDPRATYAQLAQQGAQLIAAQAEEASINASLSGATGGGALLGANRKLAGDRALLEKLRATGQAEVNRETDPAKRRAAQEALDAQLEQQAQVIANDTLELQKTQNQHFATLSAYAASLLPSTDLVGQAEQQLSGLRQQLANTTDDDEKKALQTQINQVTQQLAKQQVDAANAERSAAVDVRDALGQATADYTNAAATLQQIKDSGDTSSQAYFQAQQAANQAELNMIKANTAHLDAVAKANLRAGDDVGEALVDYNTAIQQVIDSTVEGSAERTAGLREVNQNQGLQHRQKVTARDTAQRNAGIDGRDTLANDRSEITDLEAQLRDLPEGADTERAKLQRQIADARQKLADDELSQANAERLSRIRSYDTLGQARTAVTNALATFNNTLPGTEAYYQALTDLRRTQFEQAQKELQYAQTIAAINIDPGNSLELARKAVQDARDNAALFDPGTQERADADLATKQAEYALRQEELATRQAQRSAEVFSGDYLGQANADLANALDALQNAVPGTKEFFAAQKAYKDAAYALVQAQVQAASEARKLNIDLSNPVQTAAEDLQAAREALAAAIAAGAPSSVTDKLRNDQRNAELAADQAAFSQRLSDAQIADQLGRTSHAAYLQFLQNEHDRLTQMLAGMDETSNGYRQAVDQLNQIDQLIQDAKKSMNQQFNLQDVTLPTVYEVRRAVGVSADQIRSQVVDYSSTQGTVIINGADMATVVAYINKTLGKGSTSVYTTSPRRV